jgi:tetratricopeptide (TPR) repeat protein
MTQNSLGNALQTLGERQSGTATLERAVDAYEAALLEYSRERVPLDWAMTQNNLGATLQTLGAREDDTATLERAIEAYQAVALEWTRERVPLNWAYSRHGLALAIEAQAERENDPARLRGAIDAMAEAADVHAEGGVAYGLPVAEANLERMRARLAEMAAKG